MRFATVALLLAAGAAMTQASLQPTLVARQAQVTMVTDSLGFPTLSTIGGGEPAATNAPSPVSTPAASRTSAAVLPPSPTGQGACVAHVE